MTHDYAAADKEAEWTIKYLPEQISRCNLARCYQELRKPSSDAEIAEIQGRHSSAESNNPATLTVTGNGEEAFADQVVAEWAKAYGLEAHQDRATLLRILAAKEAASQQALKLAVALLTPQETKGRDSRMVSDEFVALCSASVGDFTQEVMQVISKKLAEYKSPEHSQ